MARIVVTGGAGFIGSHVTRKLLDQGHEVAVYDFFHQYIWPIHTSYQQNMEYRFDKLLKGARIERGSTCDPNELRSFLVQFCPTHIVHLAAMPLANLALRKSGEAFRNIVEGTHNLLEILKVITRGNPSFEKLVYVSSSMIYGDFEQDPMPEEGRTEPVEIYGGMKLVGEILVKTYALRYDFPYVIVRPSAVYGPTDNNRRVLQIFIESALRGETIRVNDPQTTRLDFTFVEDAAQGMVLATLAQAQNETFNITRGEGRSLSEAIEILRQHFPDLKDWEFSGNSFRPRRGTLEISKARQLLGYDPRFSLEEGLKRYIRFVERQNRSLRCS